MSNVLTFFFFFYSCLYGGTELFHTRLCFGAPSGQSHQIDQMSSWGEQWWSLLVTVGKPSLFFFFFLSQLALNAISNLDFPDSSSRNPSCDLHLLIPASKYFWNWFYFCSPFLLPEFLLFLFECLISYGFSCSFISTNPFPRALLDLRNSPKFLVCREHPTLFLRGIEDCAVFADLCFLFLLQLGGATGPNYGPWIVSRSDVGLFQTGSWKSSHVTPLAFFSLPDLSVDVYNGKSNTAHPPQLWHWTMMWINNELVLFSSAKICCCFLP